MGRQALPGTFPGIKSDVGSDWSSRLWWLSSRRGAPLKEYQINPRQAEKKAPYACLDPLDVWLVVSRAIFSLATSNHRNYLSYQMWNQVPLCQFTASVMCPFVILSPQTLGQVCFRHMYTEHSKDLCAWLYFVFMQVSSGSIKIMELCLINIQLTRHAS